MKTQIFHFGTQSTPANFGLFLHENRRVFMAVTDAPAQSLPDNVRKIFEEKVEGDKAKNDLSLDKIKLPGQASATEKKDLKPTHLTDAVKAIQVAAGNTLKEVYQKAGMNPENNASAEVRIANFVNGVDLQARALITESGDKLDMNAYFTSFLNTFEKFENAYANPNDAVKNGFGLLEKGTGKVDNSKEIGTRKYPNWFPDKWKSKVQFGEKPSVSSDAMAQIEKGGASSVMHFTMGNGEVITCGRGFKDIQPIRDPKDTKTVIGFSILDGDGDMASVVEEGGQLKRQFVDQSLYLDQAKRQIGDIMNASDNKMRFFEKDGTLKSDSVKSFFGENGQGGMILAAMGALALKNWFSSNSTAKWGENWKDPKATTETASQTTKPEAFTNNWGVKKDVLTKHGIIATEKSDGLVLQIPKTNIVKPNSANQPQTITIKQGETLSLENGKLFKLNGVNKELIAENLAASTAKEKPAAAPVQTTKVVTNPKYQEAWDKAEKVLQKLDWGGGRKNHKEITNALNFLPHELGKITIKITANMIEITGGVIPRGNAIEITKNKKGLNIQPKGSDGKVIGEPIMSLHKSFVETAFNQQMAQNTEAKGEKLAAITGTFSSLSAEKTQFAENSTMKLIQDKQTEEAKKVIDRILQPTISLNGKSTQFIINPDSVSQIDDKIPGFLTVVLESEKKQFFKLTIQTVGTTITPQLFFGNTNKSKSLPINLDPAKNINAISKKLAEEGILRPYEEKKEEAAHTPKQSDDKKLAVDPNAR